MHRLIVIEIEIELEEGGGGGGNTSQWGLEEKINHEMKQLELI